MDRIIDFCNVLCHVSDNNVFDIRKRKQIPIHRVKDVGDFLLFKIDGKVTKIDYGLFLLFVCNKFFLPTNLWHLVKTGFLNDDVTDYSLENLYLIYPEDGIESKERKDFYYIPGYELNLINKLGHVFRIVKSELTVPVVSDRHIENNKDYVYVYINVNEKRATGRVLHRLLAVTFKNPPKNYPLLVVDHLNGKKYDFDLTNLEWVNHSNNNTRAVKNGLREDGRVLLVKDKQTGKVNEYFSLTELARELGIHPQYIVDALTNPNQTYKQRWVIKDFDDDRDWEELESKGVYSNSFEVKTRCVETGTVVVYKTQSEAARKTGVQKTAVRQFFRNKSEPCIIGGFEFKRKDDLTPWMEFNEYQLEIYRRGLHRNTRVYEVLDLDTGEVSTHYGWKRLNELTGVCKRNIIAVGKRGGVLKDKFKLKLIH